MGLGEGCEKGAGGIRKDAEQTRAGERPSNVSNMVLCLQGKPQRCPRSESSYRSLKLQLVPKGTYLCAVSGVKHLQKNTSTWKSISPGSL